MKLQWMVLAVVAVTAVSCGKPKPREVTELQVEGKAAELKPEPLARFRKQVQGLCELSEFMGTQIRSQPAGDAPASKGQVKAQVAKLESATQDKDGSKTVITATTTMALGDHLDEALRTYGQISGKPVDLQAMAGIRSTLDSVRSGWRVAALYYSDTAPRDSLKSFDQYQYLMAKLTPERLDCVREAVVRDQPRR